MLKGMLILVQIFSFIQTYEKCAAREKFLSKSKIEEMVKEHNKIRNEVALARQKNQEGKLQVAANMNYISYNDQLAQKAQDCAERCPKTDQACHDLAVGGAVLMYEGDTWSGGADWFTKDVLQKWMWDKKQLNQLLTAGVTRFGCGRVQSNEKALLKEVVVCFYDVKAPVNGTPYFYGPVTSKCLHGKQDQYLGLCNNGRRNFIHKNHKLMGHKKNKKGNKKTIQNKEIN